MKSLKEHILESLVDKEIQQFFEESTVDQWAWNFQQHRHKLSKR
jgi:Mg/Co/Ni transporter MgtE